MQPDVQENRFGAGLAYRGVAPRLGLGEIVNAVGVVEKLDVHAVCHFTRTIPPRVVIHCLVTLNRANGLASPLTTLSRWFSHVLVLGS